VDSFGDDNLAAKRVLTEQHLSPSEDALIKAIRPELAEFDFKHLVIAIKGSELFSDITARPLMIGVCEFDFHYIMGKAMLVERHEI
jgi:hypothetical protein